jgi:hypothetical protein
MSPEQHAAPTRCRLTSSPHGLDEFHHCLGVQTVLVDAVIGFLDRSQDFERFYTPRLVKWRSNHVVVATGTV